MLVFYGEIRERLRDAGGRARFAFTHASGATMELMLASAVELPRENQGAIVLGTCVAPGIISAEEVYQDIRVEE